MITRPLAEYMQRYDLTSALLAEQTQISRQRIDYWLVQGHGYVTYDMGTGALRRITLEKRKIVYENV
jgi:plasmid maintenance system antidote protein VapI